MRNLDPPSERKASSLCVAEGLDYSLDRQVRDSNAFKVLSIGANEDI